MCGSYENSQKANVNSTVDTTWATTGYWGHNSGFGSTLICYDLLQLDDDRLLVAHNTFWEDAGSVGAGGSLVALTMLDTDGTVDTTWGHNGHYVIQVTGAEYPFISPSKILQDSDGNFHLFARCNAGSPWGYHKLTSEGEYVVARRYTAGDFLTSVYDAVWADDEKSRIITVGQNTYIWVSYVNMVAIDPSDATRDDTWTGNVSRAGHANIVNAANTTTSCGGIIRTSDDNFVVLHSTISLADDRSISKILSDGTALDTTWGTSGRSYAGNPAAPINTGGGRPIVQMGDEIYTLAQKHEAASADNSISVIKHFDIDGTIVNSEEIDAAGQFYYNSIWAIDSSLYFSTTSAAPANYNIEKWNTSIDYESGFDITGTIGYQWALVPDETTREVIASYWETLDSSTAVRLIPWEHSTSDAYVLEFGHRYISFLRTVP